MCEVDPIPKHFQKLKIEVGKNDKSTGGKQLGVLVEDE